MTHDRAEPLLLDLAYGELSPDEAREVERHAADCAPCAAELEGLLATRRLAARLADAPVPARGRAELLALARRAVAPAPSRRRVRAREGQRNGGRRGVRAEPGDRVGPQNRCR